MATTTTTTTIAQKRTIRLSDRRPVTIDARRWPIIARSDWYSGQHECQANRIAAIIVRAHDATDAEDSPRHADGRVLVYGYSHAGPGGLHIGSAKPYAGYMLAPVAGESVSDDAIVRAIRRVAGVLSEVIDGDALAAQCIADLPAEEETD